MPIEKFEPWMIGRRVKFVRANRHKDGEETNELYVKFLGKYGVIVHYNDFSNGTVYVDLDEGGRTGCYLWRLELVDDNTPLPLPG